MLSDRIKTHEGFKSTPYVDPLRAKYPTRYGLTSEQIDCVQNILKDLKLTFGYGFTFLTADEADLVLNHRLSQISKEVANRLPFYGSLETDLQEMLTEMAYQMGVEGLLKFHHMIAAIENQDWCTAYKEGQDSKWYRSTMKRASEVLKPLFTRCHA